MKRKKPTTASKSLFIEGYCAPPTVALAIAVSGGSDSVALALLLKAAGYAISALHVDHGLRAESKHEAYQVCAWMKEHHIPCYVLRVREDLKTQRNLMAAARAARYDLMTQWCHAHSVSHLCTAHHRGDQAETFLMRLGRGSGIDGLSAMRQCSTYNGITVVRPLLEAGKDDIQAYLNAVGQKWIEDPTNINQFYTRNRLRALLPALQKEGITEKRIMQATNHLARANDCLTMLSTQWITTHAVMGENGAILLPINAFELLHEELALRVMRSLLRQVSDGIMDEIRFDSLNALVGDMRSGISTFRKRTLHHCIISMINTDYCIMPEKFIQKT